jgi:vitamin B12 transporter
MQFFIKSYYHNWDTNYYPKNTGPDDALYWGYKDKGVGAGGQIDFGHGLEYVAGLDYQTYEGEDEVWIIAKQEEEVKAGYLQVRTTDDLWLNTRFAGGLRRNSMGGSSNTVGSLSGEHYFTDNLFIEAVYGTSFVLPSAEDLYLADPCCGWHGNPNLEPEESRGIDYGIGGLLELGFMPLSWKLSGWSRKVDNLIDWGDAAELGITVPPGFEVTSYNREGETKVTGWDVVLRGPITDALSFSYNYTRSTEENNGVQLTNRARNNQKFSLSFAPVNGFYGVDLAAKYVGEAAITGFAGTRDAYMVANLGAHVFLDRNSRNHRLNLRVENLFDEGYATRFYNVTREDNGQTQLAAQLGPTRTYTVSYSYDF